MHREEACTAWGEIGSYLVTDEPVEFEKESVEVGDLKRISDHFRGIYRMYLKFHKANPEDVNM